jgi:DNA-directed RNA polymerase specialized sigma54-like protein
MEIKLSQKLTTNLVMTPQLQQAIRLLQLSRMELIDEVGRELEANPVLADDDVDPSPRGEREPLLPHASGGGGRRDGRPLRSDARSWDARPGEEGPGGRLGAVPREPHPAAADIRDEGGL